MARRDTARSDLYLAQLKSQSAPNTPGFGPLSPRDGGWRPPPGHPNHKDPYTSASAIEAQEEDESVQYATAQPTRFAQPKPFALQPPPIKVHSATPRPAQDGFEAVPSRDNTPSPPPPPQSPGVQERLNEHVPAAPGEQQYAAVPIPGSYAAPMSSPGYPPPQQQGFDLGVNGQR